MNFIDIDIYELQRQAQSKKIICFGSGKVLEKFCGQFRELRLERLIACIVDNDLSKEGTCKIINDVSLRIIGFHEFLKGDHQSCLLVITVNDFGPIIRQLKKYDQELKMLDYCISCFVISKTRDTINRRMDYPLNIHICKEEKIPKLIHYCWFGGKKIPEKNREWMNSWKKKCPEFEIIEWNESNYDIKKNEFMYEAYKAEKWGLVPDYARLDIIYNHGGVYLDTDVEVIKDLKDLLFQDGFAGIDNSWCVSLGLGFGAIPHHPLVAELAELYENLRFETDHIVPAPTMMKSFFELHGYKSSGELQMVADMTIYPEKILSGKNYTTGMLNVTNETFTVHHYDGSWCNRKELEIQKFKQEFYQKTVFGN